MPNKLTRTITRDMRMILRQARIPHGIITRNLHNMRALGIKVVAYVFREGALLVAPFFFPEGAARVPGFGGAFLPGGEHFEGVREGLCDYEPRVELQAAFAVFAGVGVAVEDLARVEGHGDGGLGRDAPAVEEPFEGDFEVLDGCVCVDEDDEFVRVQEVEEGVGFYPRVVHSLHFMGVEKAVVVSMDLCCLLSANCTCVLCSKLSILTVEKVVHETRTNHAHIFLCTHSCPV